MKKGTKIWIGVGIVVLILLIWIIGSYNRFVSLNQGIDGSWSEVENQYQRQADLIQNELLPILRSSVGVETQFVKDVVAARTAYEGATTQLAKDTAGQQMNSGINAVFENYPQLQANKQYSAIMDAAEGTQNRITTARGRYIDNIMSFNTAVKKFPGNIIAGVFGFSAKDYYKSQSGTTTPSLGNGTLP